MDGGTSWTVAMSPIEDGVSSFTFVDPNVGWHLAGGDIYKTEDAGTSWTKQPIAGVEAPENLAKIFFIDTDTGWAGTWEIDTVITTTDGGATWTQQELIFDCDSDENPESCVYGYLQGIHFIDALNGWIILDGDVADLSHPLLKTTDGGLTWTPQSVGGIGSFNGGGVFFVTPNIGWARRGGKLLKTVDGGN